MGNRVTNSIKLTLWKREADHTAASNLLNLALAETIKTFHAGFSQYAKTPLTSLDDLSKTLEVAHIWVKDESHRFGLNAFKVLGGSYAVGRVIAKQLNLPVDRLSYETITSEETKTALGEMTFVTATDGNHGRGIAWTAEALGQKAVVYMPKGSSEERLQNIKNHGAEASITDMNYDDAVRLANQMAEDNNWVLVQDTAWTGYEEIPTWVMQGYMTMALEAYQEILENGQKMPTHIFLQAGVGSMAAAVSGFFRNVLKSENLKIIIVEPDQADCLYQTAMANDGKLHSVTDDMNTIMAGLACGEPSTIGWEVLKSSVDGFISCPDWTAAQGMRILGNPSESDQKVVSGESGAVGIGLLSELMSESRYQGMREALNLNQNSRILFFSTEGDTDKQAYRSIVWDGNYAKPSERTHPIATLYMASGNEIRIELFPEVAPNAVNSVIALAQKGCYDNREVRRIVKDFVIQPSYNAFESDPECDYMIDGEFKANGFDNPLPLSKYAVAMAGDGSQQASGSEFFFVVGDCEERLGGKFTGIGRVIYGFEELERLLSVETMPVSVEGLEVVINEPKTPEVIRRVVVDTFGKTYEAPIKLV